MNQPALYEEKLITIAENNQKVYDAGFEKGKSEGDSTLPDGDEVSY